MPVFAEYAVRETASNLWRNRLMTIAAILTVAVSLSLVGPALLIRQGAANAAAAVAAGAPRSSSGWSPRPRTAEIASGPDPARSHVADYVNSCVYRSQA